MTFDPSELVSSPGARKPPLAQIGNLDEQSRPNTQLSWPIRRRKGRKSEGKVFHLGPDSKRRGRDGVAWPILGDCGSLDPGSKRGGNHPTSGNSRSRPYRRRPGFFAPLRDDFLRFDAFDGPRSSSASFSGSADNE